MNVNLDYKITGYKRKMLFILMILLSTVQLFAQTRVITGTVKDVNGETLIGANITTKGDKTGSITDINGNFKLSVSVNAGELEVSYIGYNTQTVSIKNKATINVVLEQNTKALEELVVVGYGTMRKSDLTGSVSSVKINESESGSATSLQSLIAGRAAGVQVTMGDAAPGSAINMKIRGTSSLTGSSEPLYVVDGIIMNSATQDTQASSVGGGATQSAQNGLTGINPQDIASMEILKDASATAIYGSMGANGVVLITTKKGKTETPKIQYSGSMSGAVIANPRKVLNLEGYIQFCTMLNVANPSQTTPIPDASMLTEMNWRNELTQNALSQNHRLNISGKTDKTTYYISGGFMNNTGIIKQTGVNQADFRMNLSQNISKRINIGTNTSFTSLNTNMTSGADTRAGVNAGLVRSLNSFRPYTSEQDILIYDDEYSNSTSPTAWLTDFKDFSKEYRLLSSLFVNVKLNKWLSMRTTGGIDNRAKTRQQWWGLKTYQGTLNGGYATYSSLNTLRYNLNHVFNISLQKKKHKLNGTVGLEALGTSTNTNLISNQRFNGNVSLKEEGLMYGTQPGALDDFTSSLSTLSGLTRWLYSYDDRYILTSTFRADGTSKFALGNKFSYFPSFAFAYRLDQEQFMANVGFISNLKFRLGWGLVGNQTITPYQTLSLYDSDGKLVANAQNNGYLTGVALNGIANPNLKWETTNQYNAGIDIGLFDNRINLTVDLYQKQSTDLLQQIDLPLNAGSSRIWVNRGTIENKGLEISADFTLIKSKNTSLVVGGNISFNRNKILNLGIPLAQIGSYNWSATYGSVIGYTPSFKEAANIFIEGYPVAQFFGHKIDGIVSVEEQAADRLTRFNNYCSANNIDPSTTDPSSISDNKLIAVQGTLPYYSNGTVKTLLVAGDPKWVDINGDGQVDGSVKDKTLIGDPNPKFTYGFTLDFKYKDFYINAVINGVYGNQIVNANRMYEENLQQYGQNIWNITERAFHNIWSETNQSATYPRLNYTGEYGLFSNFIVEDGSFMRLSSLTAGYDFKIKGGKPISNIGLSITGRNLLCLTNYTGYDPEVTSFMNDWSRKGIDWASYPNNRMITLGVQVTF